MSMKHLGRVVRHPYRRGRSHLPPPRGRDRPERGGDRAASSSGPGSTAPISRWAARRWPSRPGNIARVGELLARGVSARALRYALHLGPLPGSPDLQRRVAGGRDGRDRAPRRGAAWRSPRYREDRPDDPTLPAAARRGADGVRGGARRRPQRVARAGRAVRPRPRAQPPDRRADDVDRRRRAGRGRPRRARRRPRDRSRGRAERSIRRSRPSSMPGRRAREARDWAASDRLRDELAAAGIAVEDSRDGQRWRRVGAGCRWLIREAPDARTAPGDGPSGRARAGGARRPERPRRRRPTAAPGGPDRRDHGRGRRPAFGLRGSRRDRRPGRDRGGPGSRPTLVRDDRVPDGPGRTGRRRRPARTRRPDRPGARPSRRRTGSAAGWPRGPSAVRVASAAVARHGTGVADRGRTGRPRGPRRPDRGVA